MTAAALANAMGLWDRLNRQRTRLSLKPIFAWIDELSWIDWAQRDLALEDYTAALAVWRAARLDHSRQFALPGAWLTLGGEPMAISDWENPSLRGLCYCAEGYRLTIDRQNRR